MKRVDCLDGIRGVAALWVLVGHCMLLTGFKVPILVQPDLGVDLFILLSGFLMVFQYQMRQSFEDWDRPRTWLAFWIRRFFRIAPLYYFMLLAALIFGANIYDDRMLIDTFLDKPFQRSERYNDTSATNVMLHISFLFGLLPAYAYRTPLPDWSIGLEMQFYAVFPLIVVAARQKGWLVAALLVAFCGIGIAMIANLAFLHFPMPAFLPLKLHLFLCGVLIAADHRGNIKRLGVQLALAVMLAALPLGGKHDFTHLVTREAIVISFFAVIHLRSVSIIDSVSRLLGTKLLHWLGELSYGIYLVHLLILHSVAAWAIQRFGTGLGAGSRFVVVFTIVAAIGYSVALVTYFLIERPGQILGRKLLKNFSGSRGQAAPVSAEENA